MTELFESFRNLSRQQDKKVEGNPEVGRLVNDLLQSVPVLGEEDYEKFVNGNRKVGTVFTNSSIYSITQDILMSTFVSQIVESQLHLQEKINLIVFAGQQGGKREKSSTSESRG